MMRSAIFALSLALILSCPAAETERSVANATWVFLNSGSGRTKLKEMEDATVKQMQAAHVGNFGTLFEQGKLFLAGPLGDNGSIRGIVVLNTTVMEEVKSCFKADPLVQSELLELEQHPWLVDVMSFGTPKVPFKIEEHTLCIVKRGQNWEHPRRQSGADALLDLFPDLNSKYRSGESLISGAFLDSSPKLGVLLFASTNQMEIKNEMERAPSVKARLVELEFHPQFLGAGLFKKPEDSPPKPGKRILLFDGKTLNGWEGDTQGTWRIENGAFVGGSLTEFVSHNDFICTTQRFKNFDLRLKLKVTGTGFVNGGVQFRSERLKEPAFEMTGYQADMGEGWWGCLYDESRRNKVLARPYGAITKRIVKQNDWNEYIVRCEDNHIRLWLNGILTVDFTESDEAIARSGLIGLQVHGGGKAEASYKDITVEALP
jgi:uncharacterized protein YciI